MKNEEVEIETPHIVDFVKKLRAAGVKRAAFVGAELSEVEFFSGEPPKADSAEGTIGATIPADAPGGVLEDYESALSQLRTRRFEKKGAS